MPTGHFFEWLDRIPELHRRELVDQVYVHLLTGQRAYQDEVFNKAMRELYNPIRVVERVLSPEEMAAFEAEVEGLNRLWRE